MFLHLGADTAIPLKNVIAILDFKFANSSVNEDFIKNKRKEDKIIDISAENAKTFIVTEKTIYLSAISATTLGKRAKYIPESDDEE